MKFFAKRIHKIHFIIMFFLLLINIFEIKYEKYHIVNNKKININNKILYKGKIVLKTDLINEYLSTISNDFISSKEEERLDFNSYYYLEDYSKDLFIRSELKKNFLENISKIKNQTIIELETFYLSINAQFGNGLIIINNAIFYCEVVGCHKIILYEKPFGRRWLISKPIYIEQLNITIMQGPKVDCTNNKVLCIYEISRLFFFFLKLLYLK